MVGRTELLGAGAWIDRLPEGERTAEAARQFEALLIAHLLRTMREATKAEKEPGMLSGGDTYLEIAEQHLGHALAARGGLGIAETILRNLRVTGPLPYGRMKIEDRFLPSQDARSTPVGRPEELRPDTSGVRRSAPGADSAGLSTLSVAILRSLEQDAPGAAARVARLQEAVVKGTYSVPADVVSASLIDSLFRPDL
jgi:flagellar protein FlgJ